MILLARGDRPFIKEFKKRDTIIMIVKSNNGFLSVFSKPQVGPLQLVPVFLMKDNRTDRNSLTTILIHECGKVLVLSKY